MPKVSKLQPGFNTGEISKQVFGRVDNPRYEMALEYCQNYLPLLQGPLIRRPGTKFAGLVKDPSQMPVLIPFQFSVTQNYMLEFGDKYIRFWQGESQTLSTSTMFSVAGIYGQPGNVNNACFYFTGLRSFNTPGINEYQIQNNTITSGTILELQSPYAYADLKRLKWTQKQDTLYLTHPNYQTYKLVRTGLNTWDLKAVIFQDGPYLPLNSYLSLADKANITLQFTNQFAVQLTHGSALITVNTYPVVNIHRAAVFLFPDCQVDISQSTGWQVGDQVVITSAPGATQLNNVFGTGITNSSASQASWTIKTVLTNTSYVIANTGSVSTLTNSTGVMQPALFQLVTGSSGQQWADVFNGSSNSNVYNNGLQPALRNMALYVNGTRYWGHIYNVIHAGQANVLLGVGAGLPVIGTQVIAGIAYPLFSGTTSVWSMGSYNQILGFPSSCTFHQDRLTLSGPPSYPQEIDASMTAQYEVFSASGSNIQVNANNALQFNLTAQDINPIRWIKSNSQGMLVGVQSGEWAITPSSQGQALTPTNIAANQITTFGSADVDALLIGNAAVYIQRAYSKVRELLYYWQVGNFRSTNLSELAQHITIPTITQIVNQKEPHAFVWGLKSDGQLVSLTYNRDDVTLQATAGWARHYLGGQSDATGTPPFVNSIGVMPSGDTTYDQLWLAVKRYINGSTVGTIEYMTRPFNDNTPQEQSYHFDCGATHSSAISVFGVFNSSKASVIAFNHGLTNSSIIRFYNVVGMNQTTTDVNGNVSSSNILNYQTFVVASASTSAFFLKDFLGNYINTNSSSVYVGSGFVSQLITGFPGFTWLKNETISVLADGGISPNTVVDSSGTISLSSPAAFVQFGYQYNSDAQMLRTHEGSAQGTSIGSTRRVNRVAFMLHNVGELSFGPTFKRLIPIEFLTSNANNNDTAIPLFDGIHREGIESSYGFSDTVCFRQNSGLPGMVQAITRFLEEQDV